MIKDEPQQNNQPQYEKYIKCHVYRIHPGTFGNHCCDDQWRKDSDLGSHKCQGQGDEGAPGHGWSFTYGELVNDQAPCIDMEAVCSPYDYGYDMLNGNNKFNHGLITDTTPCYKGADKGPNSICYSPGNPNHYNPNYNYNG
jgi:hypothetical protein